jgi:hypothetical protein
MRIEKIGLNTDGSRIRTKVYDVEKKQLLGVFESRADASRFTGVSVSTITGHVRRKSRSTNNKLNRILCFR